MPRDMERPIDPLRPGILADAEPPTGAVPRPPGDTPIPPRGVIRLSREEQYAMLKSRIASLDGGASAATRELLADMLDFAVVSPFVTQPPTSDPSMLTPLWMQNEVYQASLDRGVFSFLAGMSAGCYDTGDFQVRQTGPPSMSVSVTPGQALVGGTDVTGQGFYLVRATPLASGYLNLPVAAAPAAGLQRLDKVVLHVYDQAANAAYANNPPWALEVLTGTAVASGPVAPATPPSSLVLAVLGPILNTTTGITTALITDARLYYPGSPYLRRFRARIYQATVQSIPQVAWAMVKFDTTSYDAMKMADLTGATGFRIPAGAGGYYDIFGSVAISPTTAAIRCICGIWLNGTEVQRGTDGQLGGAGGVSVGAVTHVYLNVGDYVQLGVWQGDSVARNTGGPGPNFTNLAIRLVP